MTVVPCKRALCPRSVTSPPRVVSEAAGRSSPDISLSMARLTKLTSATAAILARASPRKPSVCRRSRSSTRCILLVEWRAQARSSSSAGMPYPSSVTRIKRRPPPRISTRISRAPASSAFSKSSFTTEMGRSITSPAAMRSATSGERVEMGTREKGAAVVVIAVFFSSASKTGD